MGSPSRFRISLALATTLVFWASAFVAIKSALLHLAPGHMVLLRFLVASLTLAVYAAIRGIQRPRLRDVPWFLACGATGFLAYHVLLAYGQRRVSVGAASLMINTAPIWAAILAMIVLRERLRGIAWLGIAVSFAGIALIALGQKTGVQFEPVALAIVGAAVMTAVYVVLHKRFLSHYPALDFTCWAFWAGTLEVAAVFWPGFVADVLQAPVKTQLEVFYLGVFPGALAYVTFSFATRHLKATAVTSFMYAQPVLAMAIAWLYLGEAPTWISLAGGALAIAGVVIVNTWGRPIPASKDETEDEASV